VRPVEITDVPFLVECYEDWPPTPERGYATRDKIENWVRRWIYRDDEHCLVFPGIGLLTYRMGPYKGSDVQLGPYGLKIDNIIVHPDKRLQGHSKEIIQEATDYFLDKGFDVAVFDTLPGPIRTRYGVQGMITRWD